MTLDSDVVGRVDRGEFVIGVVGLGYVGLPTAIAFYNSGFSVWCIDKSDSVVSSIASGICPFYDPHLEGKVPELGERWRVTDSFRDSIPECDVVIVTVPTPVTEEKQLDTFFVKEAGKDIFSSLTRGSNTIVVLESTVYPGLTRDLWLPMIEAEGLELGTDLELAYCPERYNPGDSDNQIDNTARIVGSMNLEVGEFLVLLYQKITENQVICVGEIEIAESSKLIENVQRDINIALVNELAMILPSLGVDIEDVLTAAESKWNFHRYTPGVGVGGHCIPVDPYFLIDKAHSSDRDVKLISSARKINDGMPGYVSSEVISIFCKHRVPDQNRRALILGWSYKPEIGDSRGSPSERLAYSLHSRGVEVFCHDSFIPSETFPEYVHVVEEIRDVDGLDVIVLATAHEEYRQFDWNEISGNMRNMIIYDGRRVLDMDLLHENGWFAYAIGRPI